MLENYAGTIELNGKPVTSLDFTKIAGSVHIKLVPAGYTEREKQTVEQADEDILYRITVKPYMTKKTESAEFDFMLRWNNNEPMPLRTMVGYKVKETKGMVYMKLHGDTTGRIMQRCLRCGRPITNPVSQYFGMGVECGGHGYVNPFDTKEELLQAVATYRRDVLQKITWEGWIVKSAILECEEVKKEEN